MKGCEIFTCNLKSHPQMSPKTKHTPFNYYTKGIFKAFSPDYGYFNHFQLHRLVVPREIIFLQCPPRPAQPPPALLLVICAADWNPPVLSGSECTSIPPAHVSTAGRSRLTLPLLKSQLAHILICTAPCSCQQAVIMRGRSTRWAPSTTTSDLCTRLGRGKATRDL